MVGLVLVLLAVDGGAMTTYDGHLEAGSTYLLEGEGSALLAQLAPPRLRLPHHHASRIEWVEPPVLSRGQVKLVFTVERVEVQRMTENRWNSTFHCRVVSLER